MGNADLRVTFDKRKHDLNVSTFALVILLLFEDIPNDEFLTYEVSFFLLVEHSDNVEPWVGTRKSNQRHRSSTMSFSVTCNRSPVPSIRS